MEQITFECRSVTPMFMYGADGSEPELRPASIKGVMRFWWRAIHGDLPLKQLHEKEGEIFGSTDKKSSFSIKIKKYDGIPEKFKVEFLNYGTFDVQSFFELIVILGLFGQKGKEKQKTQGSIKIISLNGKAYVRKVNLDTIIELLKLVTAGFEKQKYSIEQQIVALEQYPLVEKISISKSDELYVNFLHSTKFKTIKKDLKAYRG